MYGHDVCPVEMADPKVAYLITGVMSISEETTRAKFIKSLEFAMVEAELLHSSSKSKATLV